MIGEDVTFRAAANEGRLARLNEGTGQPSILVFGTTRPSTAGGAAGDSALCVIQLNRPAGSVNAGGELELTPLEDALILLSGAAQWCRVLTGNGDFCFDMDAGLEGSSAEAILSDTTLFAGGSVRLLSCILG